MKRAGCRRMSKRRRRCRRENRRRARRTKDGVHSGRSSAHGLLDGRSGRGALRRFRGGGMRVASRGREMGCRCRRAGRRPQPRGAQARAGIPPSPLGRDGGAADRSRRAAATSSRNDVSRLERDQERLEPAVPIAAGDPKPRHVRPRELSAEGPIRSTANAISTAAQARTPDRAWPAPAPSRAARRRRRCRRPDETRTAPHGAALHTTTSERARGNSARRQQETGRRARFSGGRRGSGRR